MEKSSFMKTNEELINLLERSHPFIVHALCTIPTNSKDYLEAENLCKEFDTFLYPAVIKAFKLDKKRNNRKY